VPIHLELRRVSADLAFPILLPAAGPQAEGLILQKSTGILAVLPDYSGSGIDLRFPGPNLEFSQFTSFKKSIMEDDAREETSADGDDRGKKKSDLPSPGSGSLDDERIHSNEHHVALMLRVGDGDTVAFEELVEIHQHAVIGTVAKMLGGANDAEDIAQQVFIRIWKSAKRYKPQAKFTTWMFTITRNLVFNEMRRRQRKPSVSMNEREEEFHIETPDESIQTPGEAALQHELEDAVDAAIQALPEKQRMAVILRRYEGLPYEEIGQVLNLSLPAVKSLLFRARTQLKESLKSYLEAGEDG
jgi:RNA polymerase sigma-70 factor (ECF subfamily)